MYHVSYNVYIIIITISRQMGGWSGRYGARYITLPMQHTDNNNDTRL